MHFLEQLQYSLKTKNNNNAFCINGIFYTYSDLNKKVACIRQYISNEIPANEKTIGLITNDDIETYASIIAIWIEGKSYLPINPENPINRNELIISQTNLNTIFDSCNDFEFNTLQIINTSELNDLTKSSDDKLLIINDLAYIIFTSGSTGTPKGVPITNLNLASFIDAINELNFNLNEADKCLQMSELTFDVSVFSFLYPLLFGSCIFTIPKGKIKYSYIYSLMDKHELTFITLVPSVLNYLKKYFSEINLPSVKYCLITAEALPKSLANEWSDCVPNAKIINLYGPTENTIWSTYYFYNRIYSKSYNSILSIGKPLKNTFAIIVNSENKPLEIGEKGELCLAGTQLTPGYWKNDIKNKEAFFEMEYDGNLTCFYKTGDLCMMDSEGDLLYIGRIDFQTKIQGLRVELSEIEHFCKLFLPKNDFIAIPYINSINQNEIAIFIDTLSYSTIELLTYLKSNLPHYMIPSKFEFLEKFPLNSNGKIDRNELAELLKNN